MDKIPVRLEEQNKALPESLDYEALQMELEQAKKNLEEVNEKSIAIKSSNGGDVLRNEIREEIKKVQFELDSLEMQVRSFVRSEQNSKDSKVAELSRKFNELLNNQKDIEQTIPSFDKMIERCQSTLDQCEKDAQVIREEWAHNLSRTFHFHEADGVCPTCGQYLPEDQIAEKRKKAEENLNADKARIKQELTEKANKVKTIRADAEQQIKDIEAKKAESEKNLADTKEAINTVFSEKAKAEKVVVKTIEQCLSEDEGYQQRLKQKEELQKKLDSVGVSEDDTNALGELNEKKQTLTEGIQTLTAQLATRDMRLKILALIDGINEEQKDLVRQLSELERKEDVARRYQDRQNAIIEERINEHFSIVKWRMFRTVNNGGDPFDEPSCECYVDGVAYHDGLNQAARLNAGLDIINTLCKHYNVSAPIVLDNAESTINILQTIGQQIRLQVADTDLNIL
jgi:DNA repair exonuclease SbcCD ATPase subunit